MIELNKTFENTSIFLTKFSELEDRFDVQYYMEDLNFNNCIKLSKIVKVSGGKRLPKNLVYSNKITGYRYLRVGDLNWEGLISYDKLKFLSKDTYDILQNYQTFEDDLILAIVGATIGKCSLVKPPYDDKIILTENCAKIKIKTKTILPEFLLLLLQSDFVQKQIQLNYVQTTLPKIGLDRVLALKVPKPPTIGEQENILKQYNKRFKTKQQKETQSKMLLKSIDNYLLKELGIIEPKKGDSLISRIYTTNLNSICGGRIDPDYYSLSYRELEISVSKSRYKLVEIKKVVMVIASGKTPSSTDYSDIPTDYPIIKVGTYSREFIDLKKNAYTLISTNLVAVKGDIFVLSAAHQPEYVGKHIKYLNEKPEIDTSYVGELICIRTIDTKCHSMFLFSLLNTQIFKTLLNREKTGQTSHIYGKDIKQIKIPLPPIEKQSAIANHINGIRAKSEQLMQEAQEIFKKAKQEVEQNIFT